MSSGEDKSSPTMVSTPVQASRLSIASDDRAKPVCNSCSQPITTTQFIRVGAFSFHKEHFACTMCGKLLHDQKPRHKDGLFYCSEDFTAKFCHTCRTCGDKIVEGSIIKALGNYYHQNHFVCVTCKQPFKEGKYYEIDGQPYCVEHYTDQKVEICVKCDQAIQDIDVVTLKGKSYHMSCLQCHHCKVPLAGKGSIFQKDNHVYCRTDYLNFFSKVCSACGDHIVKHVLSVNDEFYHPECLKCSVCSTRLDQYIAVGGYLRCPDHTSTSLPICSCDVCQQPIEDEVVMSVGAKCHTACFNCTYCKTPLEKAKAKLKHGKISCMDCLMRLDDNAYPEGVSVSDYPRPSLGANPNSNINVLQSPGRLSNAVTPQSQSTPSIERTPLVINEQAPVITKELNAPFKSVNMDENGEYDMNSPTCNIEWKRGDMIGKGSFGKVFLGMNSKNGELIAIKQVSLTTDQDKETARQIQTEITLMENLRHPNIVSLLGTQRSGNKLNILMEYVPGKSLDVLLEKFGAFRENVIQSYARQLLDALAYCHAKGVVHRDIKGKNVLVDTNGNLKLADFGSAKLFQDVTRKDAPSLGYNYTPLWTAPEVLVGDYNSKVDIWSLGCVIIEMATAKPPWAEQNFEHPFRALYHIANDNTIPNIPERLSEDGKDFLLKCLCRNPDERPSADDLLSHKWISRNNDA